MAQRRTEPRGETSAAVGEATTAAKETVREATSAAREAATSRAQGLVESGKTVAATRMEGVANALRNASSQMQGEQQALASYAQRAADAVENASRSLREQDVDALLESAERFARRNSAAFLGGAFVAGFALARFLKASGERRSRASYAAWTPTQGVGDEPVYAHEPASGSYGPM